ncbi:hypothetical protein BHE74_00042746 [Ensete ventricosum]|uniref:cytokinin riboside 5'-monophosphate phosphoribohydrolase n=1 Tax=Ensete ventricosum TaxID=4639 RepID=A0A426Z6R3_ENSVE|nr:hypothetical protein B296_00033129 [Ensete ventricosum]RWV81263.1 hypothetical protein GW17_00057335 [Ensete ventricosum]RWW50998.1 hypothetical protein BHE74_00042746 [Ensete ventricosum]RZS14291.1 hypothetical protein BHM03_00045967 [Ensete ventricosum]
MKGFLRVVTTRVRGRRSVPFFCSWMERRVAMEGEKGMECTMEGAVGVEKASRFRRICVFCGSQCGKKVSYQEAAIELGKELVMPRQIEMGNREGLEGDAGGHGASSVRWEDFVVSHERLLAVIWLSVEQPSCVKNGIDLVYGGGSIGLMGLVSHAVHDGGRHLTGGTIGEVRAVSDMHERKAEMARQADAFIALPVIHQVDMGHLKNYLRSLHGLSLESTRNRYSAKLLTPQVGLLNVDGFYNSLLSFLDMAVDEGFISQAARHIIISAHSAKDLVRKLEVNINAQRQMKRLF